MGPEHSDVLFTMHNLAELICVKEVTCKERS